MWGEIAAAVIGGLFVIGANALTLSFFLGGLKERVRSHGERIEKLETKVDGIALNFAAMKGE